MLLIVNCHCGQVHLLGDWLCSELPCTFVVGSVSLLLLMPWPVAQIESLITVRVNVGAVSVYVDAVSEHALDVGSKQAF